MTDANTVVIVSDRRELVNQISQKLVLLRNLDKIKSCSIEEAQNMLNGFSPNVLILHCDNNNVNEVRITNNNNIKSKKPVKTANIKKSLPVVPEKNEKHEKKPVNQQKAVAYDKVFSLMQTGQRALKNNSSVIKIK